MQTNSPTSPIITARRSIIINAPLAAVFAFAADLRNDAQWRAEVHGTELSTPQPLPGSVATEDAFLSAKVPHSIKRLLYLRYDDGQLMRCTTEAGDPNWLSMERRFQRVGTQATRLEYALEFERKVVDEAMGFAPPLWFLRWYTNWMMGRYLRKLKGLLEAEQKTAVPAASLQRAG
ncbi:hypothetical protein GCM10023185_29350 [Hymenobacter saemangeumensis]|uniref:SRPBCC family protein n=1 Tax=Hymenobacter saemangeumensis TaxID=1084522 RepID=A0ABP8IL03_9BACT